MKTLENKIILVTGASSGIGEATARLLADQGATLVLGARRTEKLQLIADELQAKGAKVVFKALDVTQKESVNAFVAYAQQTFGRVDVLINNAGVMPLSPMSALKVDEWDKMIDVNIRGVLHGIAAVLPIMEAQASGHLINVASIGAHMVMPTGAVYCATKYAVWAISDGLRQESKNLRVTTICPGVVETELGTDITDPTAAGALKEFRKISLTADAIARGILYALQQPEDVDVNEIIIRPTASAF
ncbi:MAG: SDR family oxidoreductase [Gammaproteobacteria bacterium]|nr:MAG: SDR family oxidoreductase [Gammaproteobacteria bacterium]